jgi:superfamily II RNA helicase
VPEFAIQALESGVRLGCTTPLKAFSNQKFGDFNRLRRGRLGTLWSAPLE